MALARVLSPIAGDGSAATPYKPSITTEYAAITCRDVTGRWCPNMGEALAFVLVEISTDAGTMATITADADYLVVWQTSGATAPTTSPDAGQLATLQAALITYGLSDGDAYAAARASQTYVQIASNVAALLDGKQAAGIPTNYPTWGAQTTLEWWAAHNYNPEGANYISAITSPATVIDVEADHAGVLQDAIDAVGAGGAKLVLGARNYGVVNLTGKSNVHFIGVGARASIIIQEIKIFGGALAADYTDWFMALRTPTEAAATLATNRPTNIYFKNITFYGDGNAMTVDDHTVSNSAMHVRGINGLLFDDCSFLHYAYDSELAWHAAICNGNGLVDNWWFRRCSFAGPAHSAFFCDGLHDGGMIDCAIDQNFASMRVLHLTNNDYTLDLDASGTFTDHEMRDAQFVAYVGNTFSKAAYGSDQNNEIINVTGGHVLIKDNTVTGSTQYTRFASFTAREKGPYQSEIYISYGSVVQNNICGPARYILYANGIQLYPNPGSIGRYTVKDNTINSATFAANVLEAGVVDGPNTVSGNTVG